MNARDFFVGLVIGVGAGAAGSYFITKDICERREQLHIQEMKKTYIEKYAPKNIAVQKDDPAKIVESYETKAKLYSERGELISVDPAETEHPSDDDEDSDAPDEYYDDDYSEEVRQMKEAEKAYQYDKRHRNQQTGIISSEDYETGVPGFESKEVSYYVDDDTYVYDDSDEVVEDPIFTFGRGIKNLRWDADDSQTDDIYIRNFNINTDFKIVKNFCAYELGN